MADNIEVLSQEPHVENQQPTNEIPAEVQQLMAQRLGLETPQTGAANGEQGVQDQQQSANVEVQPETPKPFFAEYGYSDESSVVEDLKAFKQYKENPPPAVPKFETELSEKLYSAIQAGKTDEVLNILSQQRQLDTLLSADVSEDNAEQIIKTGLKVKHPDLNEAEIDFQYKTKYGIPKEPVQRVTEDDEDFAERKAEWEEKVSSAKMAKTIDAKMMKPELQKAKQSLVLPDIQREEATDNEQANVDPALLEETNRVYNELKADALKTVVPYVDEANGVKTTIEFVPDADSFKDLQEKLLDEKKFFAQFKNQEGKPDHVKWAKTVYDGLTIKLQLAAAAKQAVTAYILSRLPDNSDGNRQYPAEIGEQEEWRQHMDRRLNGY